MYAGSQTPKQRPGTLPVLPQLVPSRVCLSCDVCCRFPEPDSFLRPYFTADEIAQAAAHGLDSAQFPDPAGAQIRLVPNPSGEGYLCPAFDPATSHCRIYEHRPLDCRIYPLALMWSADRREVLLGWDTKCPFLRDSSQGLEDHANRVAALVEDPRTIEVVAGNPRLIGRFQDDVVILKPLPKLTERLSNREALGVRREVIPALASPPPLTPHPSPFTLHPLTLADRPRFEAALALVDTPLAHYAFAPHFIWRGLLDYSWGELAGHLCLFAASPDGLFMPLPPLPTAAGERQEPRGDGRDFSSLPLAPCPSPAALAVCFALMRERNRGSAVTRIENVPEAWVQRLDAMGYRVKPKDPDYLYRTADLAALAGDRYKSQRAACNRFEREHRHSFEPYRDEDYAVCLKLYREWASQKQTAGLEEAGRSMLADAESAHRETFLHHHELGLVGRVVRVGGAIRAYTFGYARSPAVFCVLLEVADRTIPGLAQFVFREGCREAAARGYAFVNTMDDSGLPSLARSKQHYHPSMMVSGYLVTEQGR